VKRQTRSLLEELNDIAIKKDSESIIESRATHVIDSAINLINSIRENYDPESAYELERRFLNSIKAADPNKFVRGIRKIRDNKETAKGLKLIEGDIKDDE
jgi:rRNA maturation endonuclease Nob1